MVGIVSEHVISFMLGVFAMVAFYELAIIPAIFFGFRRGKKK